MPENPYCFPRINLGRKTINESLFDITMGSYDGAEICELVGLYILSILGKVYGIQNVGLYWDGGLTCFHKINGPALDKIQKDIIRTFRENFGLKITIATKIQPYKKPNNTPTYMNVNSKHPPNYYQSIAR